MSDDQARLAGYANPDKLVTTAWVAKNLERDDVRVVESDEDVLLYDTGHVPGAVKIDWHTDLQHPLQRDYLEAGSFAELMRRKGISRDTTVIFYGDKNNWWACYALWVFELFGHPNCRVMDGGRAKWQAEGGAMSTDVPSYPAGDYPEPGRNDAPIRAFRDDVAAHINGSSPLIDVRSPEEYRGERLHMPDYPNEGALRGGHIPGAANIPWGRAVQENGTFKSAEDLTALYEGEAGLSSEAQVITYCRIGERSSHTWFVLRYLLGYEDVRNYDGSWTEWGNLVQAPIEK
jgi:thiosulfate/3-mercaptopyruvate sulfurtransferase